MPVIPPQPIWTPSLQQEHPDNPSDPGNVYFDGEYGHRYNVYSLNYTTTFTLLPGTFTIPSTAPGVGPRDTDVPAELLNQRATLIGVIPLINLYSTNISTPITFSFPTNNYAVSVVSLSRDHYVIPQKSGLPDNAVNPSGLYSISGGENIRLPYRNVLVINGIRDSAGTFQYGESMMTLRMEIKQAESLPVNGVVSYSEKKILVPLTITKAITNISINPFTGIGRSKFNSIPDSTGTIIREYIDGSIELNFPDFATTSRKNILDGTPDYSQVIYYLSIDLPRTFTQSNEYITIVNNRIIFNKSTVFPNDRDRHYPIFIKFLQEETPMYQRSVQRIGDMFGYTTTIRLIINKSTPIFSNQIPEVNTGNLNTIYKLPDINKMTSEGMFILKTPVSTNTDTDSSYNFIITSSNENLLKIKVTGTGANTVYTAYMYGSGTSTITVTQTETTNFNKKIATFDINVFEITPAIINCNTNLFYTNPYNRQFWTRFKPECRSSELYDSVSGVKLTTTQVDDVYDMRRKAEMLKYNKNVGGLTKNQKYAKASRGELMRHIGNSTKYITDTASPFALICPPTSANTRVSCGLTSACGVPGKERLLCYDPSVNLYNYKRTYQFNAGLQLTSNIQTTILTEPINLRITEYDNVNKRVTLLWDAPNSNGGFPITGYVITYSVDNKTWKPYESVFPYKPAAGTVASYNPVSGEINGNSVVFQSKLTTGKISDNTVYYLSVFSGNVRGLSSVPATITLKTSSVPSIINDFGFTNASDERQNLMVDLKWTDPVNTGSSGIIGNSASGSGSGTSISSFNGPPVNMYNLYYRKVPDTTWTKQTIDISSIIIPSSGGQSRRFILRNLMNQSKYDIKIEPINTVGIGPESSIITARTLMKPSTPSNVFITSKYGLLSPDIKDISRNYINITWNKPDTGGSYIKLYNLTFITPSSLGSGFTYSENILSSNTDTSYNINIGLINNNYLIDGSYSVVVEAYNGYLTSNESSRAFITVNPTSAKALIFDIEGYYTSSGLVYADMTFTINSQWQPANPISFVRVNGLNYAYQTNLSIYNQPISGSGEHKIRIPSTLSGKEIIVVGTAYTITITLLYNDGQEQTSEIFKYTPEIKYLLS
jgi:hypothetical protein